MRITVSDSSAQKTWPNADPASRDERELTVSDAKLLFTELASALGQDIPESIREYESLTQQLLYIIEQNATNGRRLADEVFRWRNEMPGGFVQQYNELSTQLVNSLGKQTPEGRDVRQRFANLYQHFKRLSGEVRSFYHPTRYSITFFENGIPQAQNRLRLLQVLEGEHGAVNLHLNLTKRR